MCANFALAILTSLFAIDVNGVSVDIVGMGVLLFVLLRLLLLKLLVRLLQLWLVWLILSLIRVLLLL